MMDFNLHPLDDEEEEKVPISQIANVTVQPSPLQQTPLTITRSSPILQTNATPTIPSPNSSNKISTGEVSAPSHLASLFKPLVQPATLNKSTPPQPTVVNKPLVVQQPHTITPPMTTAPPPPNTFPITDPNVQPIGRPFVASNTLMPSIAQTIGNIPPNTSATKTPPTVIQSQNWGKLNRVNETFTDIPLQFILESDEIPIGRLQENKVRIFSKQQSKFVSRHHAVIRRLKFGVIEIEDLKSLNGTLVNGKKISKTFLKHGDLIIITGGNTASADQYITLPNSTRSNFSSEEDWKKEIIEQLKQAFIYRFELLDPKEQEASIQTCTPQQSAQSNLQESSGNPSIDNVDNNQKRKISEVDSTESSSPKKMKEVVQGVSSMTMDDNAKNLTSLNEIFHNEFSCCICYNWFVEPTTLQCSHTFCKKCLYDWLGKNHSCPFCRKKLSKPSIYNKNLDVLLEGVSKIMLSEEDRNMREDRIKGIKQGFDEDLAKLYGMIENAKAKKIKFLNIKDRWKTEEKKTFKNGVKQYFGRCREVFCDLVGLTVDFIKSCNNEEMTIACENLDVPIPFMFVGQDPKALRRTADFDACRERLMDFYSAGDNLFFC